MRRMDIRTLEKIVAKIEEIKASSGHGRVEVEIVKGKIVMVKKLELEQISED